MVGGVQIGTTTWQTLWQHIKAKHMYIQRIKNKKKKPKHMHTYDPRKFTPQYLCNRNNTSICSSEDTDENVQSSTVHSRPRLEIT